ncbi:MAG: DUF2007 domain-containing protein [Pseudomonadota bacterium]
MIELDTEKLASRSVRIAAKLVDLALAVLACWLLSFAGLLSAGRAVLAWLLMVIVWDAFVPGRSPGKLLFKIVVASDRDYQACSRWQAIGRNIPLLCLPVLDWLFAFFRDRRRIGDSLCNTLVIRREYLQAKSAQLKMAPAQQWQEMSLETVAVYGSMLEAEILRARLEADGIPAIVVDGNLVQAYSLIAIAVGGVRVQVMAEYAARARELVKRLDDGELMIEG